MLDPALPPSTKTLTPGAGSRSSSEPRVPTDGARSRTSAPRGKAFAAKVKVAGVWVHAAELSKPAVSRPDSPNTNSPKNKGGGSRPPKGQKDPIKKEEKKKEKQLLIDMDPWKKTLAWRWRCLRRLCLHSCREVPLPSSNGRHSTVECMWPQGKFQSCDFYVISTTLR